MARIRPVFCGNFEYDARQSEIERMFDTYGRVDRVDMKTGFAFVYMVDERDAEDAIRALDNTEFGRQRRRLCVEWAKAFNNCTYGLCKAQIAAVLVSSSSKLIDIVRLESPGLAQHLDKDFSILSELTQGDGAIRRREDARRSTTVLKPTKTLFVVNFDPINTRAHDLERHFEPYGKLLRVQIRKNFGFVQYGSQDEATKALECTNMSKVLDRVITVEYAAREDGNPPGGRGRGSSPSRGRGGDSRGSPPRGGGRQRSRSPPRRFRSRSPDYRPYNGR